MRLSIFFASTLVLVAVASSEAHAQKAPRAARAVAVAVFPFKVLNAEPKFQHFGEGASEALINALVKEGTLRVVEESQLDKAIKSLSRNQTGLMEEDSALQVGKMVDARFIIIGSVDVTADQMAISSRVLEVETRQLVVSERRHGPIAEAFQLYDKLSAGLVDGVSRHLATRVTTGVGDNADAVAVRDLMMKGRAAETAAGRPDFDAAIAFYKKAALRDPNHAEARRALGRVLLAVSPARFEEARFNLKIACDLDPGNAEATTQLGYSEDKLGNRDAARDLYVKAIAIDDKYAPARFNLAYVLFTSGKPEQARPHAEAAAKLGDARASALLHDIDQRIATQRQPAATKGR